MKDLAFVVLALTQVLGVGTVTLIAHAVGRKDQADANLVCNQSLLLSTLYAALVLIAGWGTGRPLAETKNPAAAGSSFPGGEGGIRTHEYL